VREFSGSAWRAMAASISSRVIPSLMSGLLAMDLSVTWDTIPLHISNLNFSILTGCYLVNSRLNIIHSQPNTRPGRRQKDENGDLSARQVQLVSEILVCRDQELAARPLGCIKQITILQVGPPPLKGGVHQMTGKMPAKGRGRALIQENFHDRTDSANALTS